MSIQVLPILAFKDNYIWCLINEETKHCLIVDPGEAKPVLAQLKHLNLTLDALLITHHHWDHTNGIRSILKSYPVPVFGPAKEKIVGLTHPVDEGDKVELANWPISFAVLAIPGHTLGHIAYYGNQLLFCGDTLFTGGCGRLFEGTAEQMLDDTRRHVVLLLPAGVRHRKDEPDQPGRRQGRGRGGEPAAEEGDRRGPV